MQQHLKIIARRKSSKQQRHDETERWFVRETKASNTSDTSGLNVTITDADLASKDGWL